MLTPTYGIAAHAVNVIPLAQHLQIRVPTSGAAGSRGKYDGQLASDLDPARAVGALIDLGVEHPLQESTFSPPNFFTITVRTIQFR